MSSLDWMERGICATSDTPELWTPDQESKEAIEEAVAICATCPVVRDCLIYALDNEERSGVWGGASSKTRGRLLARRKRAAA
ncbi:MAG: WhiB family transcriptional regulator [Streptomycetaceae bacterium]|nr:WhiB family transcriptional regulator [Streptomycetaceae bacterium]NUS54769.1 WhiB family transcriptional regulator [Streptomycetaceae bacterium]